MIMFLRGGKLWQGHRRNISWVMVGLLLVSTPVFAGQATFPEKRVHAKEEQRQKVYMDLLELLRDRQVKLQAIIERARKEQRKIRAAHPSMTDRHARKALKQWQGIERSAKAMLVQIRKALPAADTRSPQRSANNKMKASQAWRPMAKNVALTRLDGKRERIVNRRGEVVLLHFWATWCRPCVKEIGSLQRLYSHFRTKNFAILAVSLDARKKDVMRFVRRTDLRFPVYIDPGRTVYQRMLGGIEVLPRSLLIDKAGRVVRSYTGTHHWVSPATFATIQGLLDSK